MATAEAGICNIALRRIGQGQEIDNLNQASVTARACKTFYADARDAVLEARVWPFAKRRAGLSEVADGARGQWAYCYTLPADCIRPLYLFNGSDEPTADQLVPFDVEDDATVGKVLVTNLSPAPLVYTSQITTVAKFPPLFVDCLAWKLAADLALALTKKTAFADGCFQKFIAMLGVANAAQLNATQPTLPGASSAFVRVRG